MIERYQTSLMADLWDDPAKWRRWQIVEIEVVRAIHGDAAAAELEKWPGPNPGSVAHREHVTGHDFVGWLQAWTGQLPPELARPIHSGLTSSDVVDTALGLAIKEAGVLVTDAAWGFAKALADHAHTHERTARVGRTHGRPAEATSWGLLCDDIAMAGLRAHAAHQNAARGAAVCKIGGPVGNYAELGRGVEMDVAKRLALRPSRTATQVVARDRVAAWAFSLVALLAVVERFAIQVRLGARDGELEEGRLIGQTGSSSMPQKRNPITSEKLCGLARLGRGYLTAILEDVALWDERDISHSSVERVALVDLVSITEYALLEATWLVKDLVVRADVMRSNLAANYIDMCKHWTLCRMLERGSDRWKAHQQLTDVWTVDELEDLAGQSLPTPDWFLRNVVA